MHIPSYDELTPPIPDISAADMVADLARLLPAARDGSHRNAGQPSGGGAEQDHALQLFACLRARDSARLVEIACEFSPRIQRHGDGCVVFDVSGLGRLIGDAHAIGAELAASAGVGSPKLAAMASEGGGIRIAVAPTQVAAMLLAASSPGLTVASHDAASAIAPLPLAILQQVSVEIGVFDAAPATTKKRVSLFDVLDRWGLETLGALAALPAVELSERMGQRGLALQRLACGADPTPLVPDPGVPRFVQSMELEWPIEQLEALSFVLARLFDQLSLALERADRGAAAIRVDLRLVDRTVHTRALQLPAAMRDPRVLRTLVLLDLESHPPAAGIDVVTVELDPAPARVVQYSLLERARPSAETVATLTARLSALVGEPRCGSPELLDTHRPDAFAMRRFTSDAGSHARTLAGSRVRELGSSGTSLSGGSGARGLGNRRVTGNQLERAATCTGERANVARCIEPSGSNPNSRTPEPPSSRAPEPPDTRGAELSNTTRGAELSIRRFRPPIAIRVVVEQTRPVAVAIDRRGMPGGRVVQAAGPWRTSGAWWDAAGVRWDRDEWDVALGDGSLCRLFCDRISGKWFLEGVID